MNQKTTKRLLEARIEVLQHDNEEALRVIFRNLCGACQADFSDDDIPFCERCHEQVIRLSRFIYSVPLDNVELFDEEVEGR